MKDANGVDVVVGDRAVIMSGDLRGRIGYVREVKSVRWSARDKNDTLVATIYDAPMGEPIHLGKNSTFGIAAPSKDFVIVPAEGTVHA